MKKTVKIIICIIALALVGGLVFTTIGLIERNQIIDKLEEENEELKDEIESLEEEKEELNYNLSLYKDTFGDEIEDEEKEDEEDDTEIVEDYSNIKKVSLKTLKKMINKEESFILLISQTYCSHCIAFKPTFNEALSDNNLIGYELDLLTLSENDYNEFVDMFPTIDGTPTTVFFQKGKEMSEETRIVGAQDKDTTIEAFKENGFIK